METHIPASMVVRGRVRVWEGHAGIPRLVALGVSVLLEGFLDLVSPLRREVYGADDGGTGIVGRLTESKGVPSGH